MEGDVATRDKLHEGFNEAWGGPLAAAGLAQLCTATGGHARRCCSTVATSSVKVANRSVSLSGW